MVSSKDSKRTTGPPKCNETSLGWYQNATCQKASLGVSWKFYNNLHLSSYASGII